jgi:hypothetical protein
MINDHITNPLALLFIHARAASLRCAQQCRPTIIHMQDKLV